MTCTLKIFNRCDPISSAIKLKLSVLATMDVRPFRIRCFPFNGQSLPQELVGEAVDLDAAHCTLDIRKHHYRESVYVEHGVEVQALLGLRDASVNEELLVGELVNNRELVVCEHCNFHGIQLLVVKNVEGCDVSSEKDSPNTLAWTLLVQAVDVRPD